MLVYQKSFLAKHMQVDPRPPDSTVPFVEEETSRLFDAIQKYNEDRKVRPDVLASLNQPFLLKYYLQLLLEQVQADKSKFQQTFKAHIYIY